MAHAEKVLKTKADSATETLSNRMELIKGIPRVPILVTEFITPSSISPFVARNAVWGGIALVASSNAPERASRSILRPDSNIIELGSYKKGDYDILRQLNSSDGYIRHNGVLIQTDQSKSDYISDLCQQLGVNRAVLHLQNPQLISTMEKMGLEVHESLQVYQNLGKKGVFNDALGEFSQNHPDSTIGRFGVNFNSLDEIADEVVRLAEFGVCACIKFDETAGGAIPDSGSGVHFIPDYNNFGSKEKFKEYMLEQLKRRNFNSEELAGLVQMYIPNSTVLSISSGQAADGEYLIYEAHTQTQISYATGQDEALTADGGVPLKNDEYTNELLTLTWPQLAEFYKDNGVTGDQNMNLVILPPDMLEIARKIYKNDRLSAVVPIDLNPRSISGTKRIMGRFSEETSEPINWENFAARSLHIDPFFAANPHLIYKIAADFGLHPGKGGNMSLTNFGTLIPERIRGQFKKILIKTFVQNIPDPVGTLAHLEEIISKPLSSSFNIGQLEIIRPEEVPDADNDQRYEAWLENQFKKVLSG